MNNLPDAIIASGSAPLLVWHSGSSKADQTGKGRFSSYLGWAIEAGKDPILDRACVDAGYKQMRMQHFGGDESEQWNIGEELRIFPLTAGPCVKSALQYNRGDTLRRLADVGLVAAWPATDYDGRKGRSSIAFRGIVPALWAAGYTGLVQVGAKGMVTDSLLQALADHAGRARMAVQDALGRTISPPQLLLPLVAGPDKIVGKEGAQSNVTLIACGHPKTYTAEEAQALLAPEDIEQALDAEWPEVQALDAEWPEVQAWARGALEPRTPTVVQDEYLQRLDAAEDRPRLNAPQKIEHDLLGMLDIVETTSDPREVEMIRLEALDARNDGRLTVGEQAVVAKAVLAAESRLQQVVDATPF